MASSLEILHPVPASGKSTSPSEIDIVFVHGLNVYGVKDHARNTWTHDDGTFWPQDRLPKSIPSARIMLFSYNSSVVVDVANVSIAHHATSLLDKLYGCRSEDKCRPIIFVAHSLGGLVVKQALINAVHEKRYEEIRKATFGLVFFGTPHQGGNGATHADRIASVLSVITGQTKNTLLKALSKGSFLSEATTDQFRPQLNDYKVLTFYESKKTPLKKSWGWARSLTSAFVVDRTSAKLGSPDEILLDLNADHSQLCKFCKEPGDPAYETVGRNIKEIYERACQVVPLNMAKLGANTKKKDLEIGIQGFETYMQVVTKQRGTNISSSSIHLADYTQFFSRQEFKTWLSASESVSSFEDVPEAVGGEVDVHHVPTRFNLKKKKSTIFRTDKILWLTGPQGNGTGHISNYLKKGLAARSARDTRIIMEFTCASCSEPVSSAFCRQFYKEVVYRNSHPPYNIEPITLNIDILAESIHEYSRDQLSRLELTIFIEGLESVNRQKERKEFLTNVLNLFQRMVKGKSLFKAARMLLISRYDLGIEMTIEKSGVEVTPMIFAQERTECLNSLQVTGVTDRRTLVADAHAGSLQWLRVHPEYCKWIRHHHSSMLWVQGKPASGKSTLVKYFREHIIPSTSSTFCIVADFFYSHRGGELGKSHTVMLQSLLYQILDQAGSFFECFLDEYRLLRRQHGASFKWPEASLKRILLSLVTHQMIIKTTVHLYIIIDALDESNEEGRRSILDIFRQISSTKGPVVVTKVLMASRPNVEVEDILRDCHLIRLQDENRDDIGAFVSYYLKDVYDDLHFEEQEYLNAKEYIVENSQGVFLWTHFVVQELAEKARRGLSRREIRQTLESLPFELYGVYERIIRELLAEEDDGEIQKSEKMFQLVLFAARPLTVAEFSQAMAVPANYSPHVFTEEDLEDNLIRPTIKRPVLCRGRNLIETSYHVKVDELFPHSLVHAVADSDEHDIGIVQLMHHSAREFLLRPNGYMKETKRFNLRDRACHGVLAIICLRYLQLIAEKLIKTAPHAGFLDNDTDINGWCDADIEAFVTYLGEKRFFRYALEYLPWHMDRTGIDVESGRIAMELYHKLFVNMNEPSFRYMRCIFRHSFSKRHIPVGCSIWVDRKSSMIHDEDLPIAFDEGLIITAAQARKVDVVLALVHTAATNDPKSFTVLLSLAALGNEQALRLFLENGPVTDINETGGEHGNVLNLAAYLGHMSIVRVLLERGAEINAVSSEYGNVLEAAAAGAGSEEVVRLLIDAGADLDAEPGLYGAAVEVATYHGHQRVVNLLVNRGAIVVGKTAMLFGNGWGGGAWTRSTRAPEFSESPIGIDYRRTRIRQRGRRVAGGELRHLAGSPGGGGDIRVLSYSN